MLVITTAAIWGIGLILIGLLIATRTHLGLPYMEFIIGALVILLGILALVRGF